jgi:hypothetical protein
VGAAGLLSGCEERPDPYADDLQPTERRQPTHVPDQQDRLHEDPVPRQPDPLDPQSPQQTDPVQPQTPQQPAMPHHETDPERGTGI